jgi:CHAT domain-containing protein/Tfp pilus assembly protein PilF
VTTTLRLIGQIDFSRGDYAAALARFQACLERSEAIGDAEEIAVTYDNIAAVYFQQGDFEQARRYYEKILETRAGGGHPRQMAVVHGGLGKTLFVQGHDDEALEQFRLALSLAEQVDDAALIYAALGDQAVTAAHHGEFVQAGPLLERALEIARELNSRSMVAETLHQLARFHELQGNYVESLTTARQSAEAALEAGYAEVLWRANLSAGVALEHLGRRDEARQSLEESVRVIESMRGQVAGSEQQQRLYFEGRTLPYRALVRLLFDLQRPRESLTWAERAKSRVLMDALTGRGARTSGDLTPEQRREEQELRGRLAAFNTQVRLEEQRPVPDGDRLSQLRADLRQAQLAYEEFQTLMSVLHPEGASRRGELPPLDVERAAELDETTVIVEYVVNEDAVILFVIASPATGGDHENGNGATLDGVEVRSYLIPVSALELAGEVDLLRQQLIGNEPEFSETSQRLYELLLAPAAAELDGRTSLVIIPDGPLWAVPFAALQPRPDRYLIEQAALTCAPSLSAFYEMRKAYERPGRTHSLELLALGNPAIDAGAGEQVQLAHRRADFGDLPGAEREVQELEALYGEEHSRVYVGADATEGRLKSDAAEARVLHLAAHGLLNDRNPMYSHILLARDVSHETSRPAGGDEHTGEDGLLEAWELMDMDLNADLVVLSACESAGTAREGEGIIGLSWTLFLAGCPASLSTLWQVDDDATRALMVEFHRQLLDRPDHPAEALRQSQLAMLRGMLDSRLTRQPRGPVAQARLQTDPESRTGQSDGSLLQDPWFWAGFSICGAASR